MTRLVVAVAAAGLAAATAGYAESPEATGAARPPASAAAPVARASAQSANGLSGQATPAGPSLPLREVTSGQQSNVGASKQAVSRTAAQFATVWKEHDWDRPAPAIDFSREMAVSIFLGTQQSAGVSVRITSISLPSSGGVLIRYRVDRPAAGAVAAQVLTFPYQVVAVPAHDGPYQFEQVN